MLVFGSQARVSVGRVSRHPNLTIGDEHEAARLVFVDVFADFRLC
jgi:hypothetical protein